MKRYLPFIIIAAVALLTVGAGAWLYQAKRHTAAPLTANNTTPATQSDDKAGHIRGGANASVTLEEFGDFQCPSCSVVSDVIHKLEEDYGARLRVIFRNFPLKMHSHALEAAVAAEAAGAQGRFWEMHDVLYRNQSAWSAAANVQPVFETYAANLGLDVERFRKDLQSREVNLRVALDTELGTARGVKNTPTIFINGRETSPPFTPERLHEAIEEAIAVTKKP